jgi:hypothetical protein
MWHECLQLISPPTARFILLLVLSGALYGCARDDRQQAEARQRERGEQIVAEYRRRDGAPNRHLRLRMTMQSPNEPQRNYEFEVWRKQNQNETRTLMRVLSPQTERDLNSLSIERRGQRSENVSYRRASDEFQEFDSDRRVFGGLTVLELLGEWDNYNHRLISERETDGVRLYEVENTLKPGETSSITRFVALFRADTMLPVEAHLFNAQNVEVRSYYIREHRTVDGRPTVWRVDIENHQRNTRLGIEMLNVNFNEQLDDNLFTRENLRRLATT